MTRKDLPFASNAKSRSSSVGKAVLNIVLATFVLMPISSFLLLPILKILEVPSFAIGTNYFLLMRWENTQKGFSFEFTVLSFIIVIFILLLLTFLTNMLRRLRLPL